MNYTYDDTRGKWLVVMGGDVVVREFDTEDEAKRFVSGEDIGTPEQDRRVLEAYVSYFKKATGVNLLDPHVAKVDLDKITVDYQWHTECLMAATEDLTKDERTMFLLYSIGKMPRVGNDPLNAIEHAYLEEGAVQYVDEPASAEQSER